MSEQRLRGLEPRDTAGIKRVLTQTMLLGQPLPFEVMDFDALLEYFLGYYLDEEPESGRVVVDQADEVIGYLLGCTQPAAESRWRRAAALRLAARWARRWRHYDPMTRWFYGLRLRDAREVLLDPGPSLPAFCHWHLTPAARGRWGRTFMRWFRDRVAAAGLESYGGEHAMPERQSPELFLRLGAQITHRVRHHTLSALTGQPVWRITIEVRCDEMRW